MGFFRKRQEQKEASLIATLTKAMGEALGGLLSAQSQQVQQSTAFLGVLQDMSAKKAAQIMGQKGGRTTQERKRKRSEAIQTSTCVLCSDPMHRGTTLEQIALHRQHESVGQPLSSTAEEPERGN